MEKVSHDDLLVAAVIGSARGLRGEVTVSVRTDRADTVLAPGETLTTSVDRPSTLTITRIREHAGRVLLQFLEVATREEAEALRGVELLVPPTEEDDAWYPGDLVGLEVLDLSGNRLGTVKALLAAPAHDLLVVDNEGVEVMVPFVSAIVVDVRVEQGEVLVDPPTGLFPRVGD